jgi:hypothetical protein
MKPALLERYGETAKTVNTDTALVAHPELQTPKGLLLFKFCNSRLQFFIRWFGHMCCSLQGNTLSIFFMIRSAHCTAGATMDSVRGLLVVEEVVGALQIPGGN